MPSPAAASPGIPLSPPVLIAKLVKEQHLSASFFTHRASLSPFFSSRIQFPPPVRTLSLRGTHCSILFVAAVWEQLWTDRAVSHQLGFPRLSVAAHLHSLYLPGRKASLFCWPRARQWLRAAIQPPEKRPLSRGKWICSTKPRQERACPVTGSGMHFCGLLLATSEPRSCDSAGTTSTLLTASGCPQSSYLFAPSALSPGAGLSPSPSRRNTSSPCWAALSPELCVGYSTTRPPQRAPPSPFTSCQPLFSPAGAPTSQPALPSCTFSLFHPCPGSRPQTSFLCSLCTGQLCCTQRCAQLGASRVCCNGNCCKHFVQF